MKPPDGEKEAGNINKTIPTNFYRAEIEKDGVKVVNPHVLLHSDGIY